MIYTGLNRAGEIVDVKAHGGGDIAEMYGSIGELNPVYYKLKTITGTLPLSYKALGKPLSDYLISGNTVQDGAPTPDNPVDVVGCGERTGNLFDKVFASGYNISSNGNPTPYTDNSRCAILEPIDVSEQNTVTFSYTTTASDNKKFIYSLFNGNTLVIREAEKLSGTSIDVSLGDKLYLCVYSNFASVNTAETTKNIMLNIGPTPLPYEPYGYKLSLTVNGTEYPIYLGEAQTTRQIKKLVLTGEEDWLQSVPEVRVYRINVPNYLREMVNIPICTHYKGIAPAAGTGGLQDLETALLLSESGNNYYYIRDDRFNNANDFKSYLSTQYAAGTPVTVWYVLAEPETGIVNEPLMKIGDYADTVTMAQAGVTIPTAAGTNTLTVNTTVQPSEVSITGNIKEVY